VPGHPSREVITPGDQDTALGTSEAVGSIQLSYGRRRTMAHLQRAPARSRADGTRAARA